MPRSAFRPPKFNPVLYVDERGPETREAVELLKNLGVHVLYLSGNDEEMTTPWLVTQASSYYGLDQIRAYVEHWRDLTAEITVP